MNIERIKQQLLQRPPTPRGGGINVYLEAYECIKQLERELRSCVADANRYNGIANALGIRSGVVDPTRLAPFQRGER